MSASDLWYLLAGLGLFLFGMHLVEEALKKLTGRKFKQFLQKHTTSAIKGILTGAVSTALLQSSSLVILLVMSFTGAGIISLQNSIGIILGANLGTTFTGWMISLLGFKLSFNALVMPLIAIGGLGLIFLKNEFASQFSKFVLGFAFLFMGLGYIKDGFSIIAEQWDLSQYHGAPFPVYLLLGIAITATIQSSSASMAIYLSALASGLLQIDDAIYLIIGSDIGTTLTTLLGSINGNTTKKRTAIAHTGFNLFQGTMAVLLIELHKWLVFSVYEINDPLVALVLFQSQFNLTGIVLLLPFVKRFAALIEKWIPEKQETKAKYLSSAQVEEPEAALSALRNELIPFTQKTLAMLQKLFDEKDVWAKDYIDLKAYENEVTRFYLQAQRQWMDAGEAAEWLNTTVAFRRLALAVKDMKDVRHNLMDLFQSSEDEIYAFAIQLRQLQCSLYDGCMQWVSGTEQARIKHANELITQIENSNEKIQEKMLALKSQADMGSQKDWASIMNLVRSIHASNESLQQAIGYYVKSAGSAKVSAGQMQAL